MLSDMPNVPTDTRTLPNASYFDRYFWLSEPSLPDTLVISGQFGLVMPDMRIIHLKRALSMPDMLFILLVYASYLAGDNRNNKSRVAYNGHRNSREYWVARRIVSLVVGQYIIELL